MGKTDDNDMMNSDSFSVQIISVFFPTGLHASSCLNPFIVIEVMIQCIWIDIYPLVKYFGLWGYGSQPPPLIDIGEMSILRLNHAFHSLEINHSS